MNKTTEAESKIEKRADIAVTSANDNGDILNSSPSGMRTADCGLILGSACAITSSTSVRGDANVTGALPFEGFGWVLLSQPVPLFNFCKRYRGLGSGALASFPELLKEDVAP